MGGSIEDLNCDTEIWPSPPLLRSRDLNAVAKEEVLGPKVGLLGPLTCDLFSVRVGVMSVIHLFDMFV